MTNYINRPEAEQTRFLREHEKLKKKRSCLKCDKEFKSVANRICDDCKRGESWGTQSEALAIFW